MGNEEIIRMCFDNGAIVDLIHKSDDEMNTPLIICCIKGYEEMVKYLIAQGAEINYKNKLGNTALAEATRCRRAAVLKMLLQYPQDEEAVARAKKTAKNIKNEELINILEQSDSR